MREEFSRSRITGACAAHVIHYVQPLQNSRLLDAVIDAETIFAILNESGLPEKHKLLGDVSLRALQECGQVANTRLIQPKRVEQAQTCWVRDRSQYSYCLSYPVRYENAPQTIFRIVNIV